MKRSLTTMFMLIAAITWLTACGGGNNAVNDPGAADGGADDMAFPVAAADQASVSGTINFSGTAPENEAIAMDGEPDCAAQYTDGPRQETVMVNDNGTMANVFVYVKSGLDEGLAFPKPAPAVLDQQGCRYTPHVLGVQTGQTLIIRNSDDLLHNIHPRPEANRAFNVSQPKAMESEKAFTKPEVMIPIGCDVHDWMSAFVGVQAHPYFSVSDGSGGFSIDRLPAGTYTLGAWHEEFGEKEMSVTVEAGGSATVDFDFSGS